VKKASCEVLANWFMSSWNQFVFLPVFLDRLFYVLTQDVAPERIERELATAKTSPPKLVFFWSN
jgi:hypothetical protein